MRTECSFDESVWLIDCCLINSICRPSSFKPSCYNSTHFKVLENNTVFRSMFVNAEKGGKGPWLVSK